MTYENFVEKKQAFEKMLQESDGINTPYKIIVFGDIVIDEGISVGDCTYSRDAALDLDEEQIYDYFSLYELAGSKEELLEKWNTLYDAGYEGAWYMVKDGEKVIVGGVMDDYDLDVLEKLPSYSYSDKATKLQSIPTAFGRFDNGAEAVFQVKDKSDAYWTLCEFLASQNYVIYEEKADNDRMNVSVTVYDRNEYNRLIESWEKAIRDFELLGMQEQHCELASAHNEERAMLTQLYLNQTGQLVALTSSSPSMEIYSQCSVSLDDFVSRLTPEAASVLHQKLEQRLEKEQLNKAMRNLWIKDR